MTPTLKIGLTSGNLTLVPCPTIPSPFPVTLDIIRDDYDTVLNERLVTYTGVETEELTLNWQGATKEQYETLKAYCNVAMEYYVELAEADGTKHFDGFAYLTMDSYQVGVYEPFRFNFSITIHEL